jgi:hypothetical protein
MSTAQLQHVHYFYQYPFIIHVFYPIFLLPHDRDNLTMQRIFPTFHNLIITGGPARKILHYSGISPQAAVAPTS